METKKIGELEKIAFGIGAVGKDMAYMLSASYILYYFQNVIGVSALAMGVILMAARIFDAFNDPIMGLMAAKTKAKMGRFKPWILIGTISNAVVLVAMFTCPPSLDGDASGLVIYAAVTYVLWGVTYTMMDIPYWSMIPAFTGAGKDREDMSRIARTCAAIGSGIISAATVSVVSYLGHLNNKTGVDVERLGYTRIAIIVAAIFVLFTLIMCFMIKDESTADMEVQHVSDMFKALLRNDQTMTIVVSIVCINTALYFTSNLIIYFFKYDFTPMNWERSYTIFNTAGFLFQLLAMIVFYPLLRKKLNTRKVLTFCIWMAMIGYLIILGLSYFKVGSGNVYLTLIPAFLIMAAMGMLNIVVTVLLADTVDYGELKNDHRDESVIFSMQTFVVKVASGVSALLASLVLYLFKVEDTNTMEVVKNAAGKEFFQMNKVMATGFELSFTVLPILVLIIGLIVFRAKYKLDDEILEQVNLELQERRQAKGGM